MVTIKKLARGVYLVWPNNDTVILVVDCVPVAKQDFSNGRVQLLTTATRSDRYYTKKHIGQEGELVPHIACPVIFHRED